MPHLVFQGYDGNKELIPQEDPSWFVFAFDGDSVSDGTTTYISQVRLIATVQVPIPIVFAGSD